MRAGGRGEPGAHRERRVRSRGGRSPRVTIHESVIDGFEDLKSHKARTFLQTLGAKEVNDVEE